MQEERLESAAKWADRRSGHCRNAWPFPTWLRFPANLQSLCVLILDSVATRRHLLWLSFLAPFPLPERARMSGRYRRYLSVLGRRDMPSRIASTASIRVL